MAYKLLHGLVLTCGQKLLKSHATKGKKYSFIARVMNDWNYLPSDQYGHATHTYVFKCLLV